MEEVLHVKLTDRIEFDKVKTRTRLLILPRRAVLEHGPIRQIDRHSLTVSQMRETEHDYEHREDELTPIHGHPQSRSFVFVVASPWLPDSPSSVSTLDLFRLFPLPFPAVSEAEEKTEMLGQRFGLI